MARRRRFSIRRGVNIPRVVSKVAGTVLALYAGGIVISELGSVMNGTASPFYDGLTLIGWTITDDGSGTASSCTAAAGTLDNCITATNEAGILAVIGIIGIASIVMEFVKFRM